ncbi:MAG: HAD family hydrolase [Oscillospiraceae bacterium]|jgi:putative hydrolase of the HAD superfamily|nr:HAD family hydrolase [Oscillospiraceae bacterium]
MISTLFIDLDGTLVDSKLAFQILFDNLADKYLPGRNLGRELEKSFRKHCADAFKTLPHTDYLNGIGWGWDNMFYSDFSGEDSRLVDLKNAADGYRYLVLNSTLNEYGVADRTLIKSMVTFMQEKWLGFYRTYTDTFAFLDECKNYTKYILTNGFVDIQMKKIHYCGLYDKFDGIYISGMYGFGKPDSKYFQNVLSSTGVDINSTVMIGNSLSSDIVGAVNVGIKTIWKKEMNISENEKNISPTAIIENLIEITSVLNSM